MNPSNARLRTKPARLVRYAAGLVALSLLLASAPAPAGEVPVFLGAVGVGKAKPEMRSELRSRMREELSSAEFAAVRTNERYMLSATLVRLDSVLSSDSVRATCVVSVAVLRDGGSTLYAVVHGRASATSATSATDAKAQAGSAQSDALRAAVHSAMVRIPKTLH